MWPLYVILELSIYKSMAGVRRLGDICKMYQPKTISTDMLVPDGRYPVFGANGIIGRYDQYNHSEPELLMTCRGATCGTINVSLPYSWINGNAMVIHPINDDVLLDYLKYHLMAIDLSTVITGAAQPQITRQSLIDVSVIVPSVEDQKRIVEELNLLTGIIEKKEQQICDFDALEQSLFSEMFGNLITNDKSWPYGSLSDICAPKSSIKRATKCYIASDTIDYIDISSIDNKRMELTETTPFILSEAPSRAQQVVRKGDVLISMVRPNLKNIAVVNLESTKLVASTGFCVLRANELSNPSFIKSLIGSDVFTQYLMDRVTGANYPAVKEEDIKGCKIGIPPVALQDQFSRKALEIDRQKKIITSSNKEIKTLLSGRMHLFFKQ